MRANSTDWPEEVRDPEGRMAGGPSLVVGMSFDNARIVVSGRRFERCRFVGCQLVFDGRPVHLVDNSFDRCAWVFEDAAAVTLDLLAALCRGDPLLRATMARELGLHEQAQA